MVGQTASRTNNRVPPFEELLWDLYRRLNGRPPFNYNVARRILWAVVSGKLPLSAALHACEKIRNELGRKHNTEVVRLGFELLKGYDKFCMEFSAQYLSFSSEQPDLAIRVPSNFFFVQDQRTIFPLFQFSKVDAPTNHQRGYIVSLAQTALVRAGFDAAEVWLVDFSELLVDGVKKRAPRIYLPEHLILPSEAEVREYLSVLAEVHQFIGTHTKEEIAQRAGREPRRR